mmetsp:Transcript_7145/g.21807  ORF Transcript_7145/g.21807 Transcript_7145/m.21807 type:complete len:275 (-) Transcript_7145:763-1587(-)
MLPVLHANSSSVWSVSTSCASISVTSRSLSNMCISTVPFLVTICFKLNVFSFSLGGSNAVFRSAKGSASCFLCSWMAGFLPVVLPRTGPLWEWARPLPEPCVKLRDNSWVRLPPMLPGLPTRPWLLLGRLPSGVAFVGTSKARFAVTGRALPLALPPSGSELRSRIFIRAFSIFRTVALSMLWKATSSGLVSLTCGCWVSWRKRQSERITCATTSTPLAGVLPIGPTKFCTCFNKPSGQGAEAAATRPSLPWRSSRSRGINLFVFCRSITAVMK